MNTNNYHKDLYLPDTIEKCLPNNKVCLRYSDHARRACTNDRYGKMPLVKTLDFRAPNIDIIEAEILPNGRVKKLVVRARLNKDFDISLAVIMGNWLVKSCWLNRHNDNHATLDYSKYSTM